MAQTKTTKSRSSGGTNRKKSSSNSRSNGNSTKNRSSRTSSGSRSGSQKRSSSRSAASSGSNAQNRRRQSGSSDKSPARSIVEKAKAPAMAGRAALVGIAGGLALGRKRRNAACFSRMSTPSLKAPKVKMPKLNAPDIPKPGTMVKAVGSAAGQVEDRSTASGADRRPRCRRRATRSQTALIATTDERQGQGQGVFGGAVADRLSGRAARCIPSRGRGGDGRRSDHRGHLPPVEKDTRRTTGDREYRKR